MSQTLVLVGLACIIAAVVGGGLKLLGIEIGALASVRRQVLLGGVGVAVLLGTVISGGGRSPVKSDRPETLPSGSSKCYARHFDGIPQDRIASLEVGTQAADVIREDQPKDKPVGLLLTDGGQGIGGLRFQFFASGNGLFKIQSVFDAHCRKVEEFANASRPGSAKTDLQNHEALRVRFGDGSYTLFFGARPTTIRLNFDRAR